MPWILSLVASVTSAPGGPAPAATARPTLETDYIEDVRFALDELEKAAGGFFKLKNIDWNAVEKQFLAEAREVKTDQEHLVLLVRLLARVKDGHAEVRPGPNGKEVEWPEDPDGPKTGLGLFLCRSGKKVYVKNSWATAASAGLKPGMEILRIDGEPVLDWLARRQAEIADLRSFSTDHQAFFYTCHWGLADPMGTRREIHYKDLKGKSKRRELTYTKASVVPDGPAFPPGNQQGSDDVRHATTEKGYGYIHVRRCKGDLPEQVDEALKALGNVPGMILDFRGNSGGGFDHEGLLGRFVPQGKKLNGYQAAGALQYGGPVVVIVDATCRSAGETGAGYFKEYGRAYMIGESPTAGMSSQKTTISLPSGLFELYVSIGSNKSGFNKGRGVEGIGVEPHEIVEYDPKDLREEVDTLIQRAEDLLEKYPQREVEYEPRKFGWRADGGR